MKFTLSWLKDHLHTSASLAEIVETLTRIGLEVEHVHDPSAQLKEFTIGQIVETQQHPNADRLRVCKVDIGVGDALQVVCGAPNAREGLKTVFAPPGAYIPAKKITLGKGIIRGVESLGMLCSAEELELSDDHDGIIELPKDAPIGVAYAQWAGIDDPIIEINLTPNRADAAGVFGVARDLVAEGLGAMAPGETSTPPGSFPCPVKINLDLEDGDRHLAPFFGLRLIKGVTNGSSPAWLQHRLRAIGLRPINALVDITNYITFDRSRPLHVFDAKKIHGDITIRLAHAGETIVGLDGKTYHLDETMVVISDDSGVQSIAGIMGGAASGCDETTTDVLIETALWDPENIARTGRKLNIATDARYRFERGVDPSFAIPGIELATQMALTTCGGEASTLCISGSAHRNIIAIDFPWNEIRRLAGIDIAPQQASIFLNRLGFDVQDNGLEAKITAPSWRQDIASKADIVEEIIRLYGVDNINSTPLPRTENITTPILTLIQKRARICRRALAAQGFVEAITWSFISNEHAVAFGGGQAALKLLNPIAADLSDMRPSLLPGLLSASHRNAARGLSDQALFEVGQIFINASQNGQLLAAAGIRRGRSGAGRDWSCPEKSVTIFDIKSDVMTLLQALGVSTTGLQITPCELDWLHPGRSATLQFGPKATLGYFGELHPRLLKDFDIDQAVVAFELVLDNIPAPKNKLTKIKPKLDLCDLQPLTRDFAFLVDSATRAGDLLKAVSSADRTLITQASIFDLYEGAGVPEGKKSIGVSVVIQPRERTLTDIEIDTISQAIILEANKKTGATLR